MLICARIISCMCWLLVYTLLTAFHCQAKHITNCILKLCFYCKSDWQLPFGLFLHLGSLFQNPFPDQPVQSFARLTWCSKRLSDSDIRLPLSSQPKLSCLRAAASRSSCSCWSCSASSLRNAKQWIKENLKHIPCSCYMIRILQQINQSQYILFFAFLSNVNNAILIA